MLISWYPYMRKICPLRTVLLIGFEHGQHGYAVVGVSHHQEWSLLSIDPETVALFTAFEQFALPAGILADWIEEHADRFSQAGKPAWKLSRIVGHLRAAGVQGEEWEPLIV